MAGPLFMLNVVEGPEKTTTTMAVYETDTAKLIRLCPVCRLATFIQKTNKTLRCFRKINGQYVPVVVPVTPF